MLRKTGHFTCHEHVRNLIVGGRRTLRPTQSSIFVHIARGTLIVVLYGATGMIGSRILNELVAVLN